MDLPPGTGDVHLTLVQALPLTGAIVVTTPQMVALSDARKGAEMFRFPQIQVPILGVVENMSYFTPDDAPDKKYYLFGREGGQQLASDLNVPLLAQIPIREGLADNADRGVPVAVDKNDIQGAAFYTLAQLLAQQVAIRNATQPPTARVEMLTS